MKFAAKTKTKSNYSTVKSQTRVSGLSKTKLANEERAQVIAQLVELNAESLKFTLDAGGIFCNPAGCSRG